MTIFGKMITRYHGTPGHWAIIVGNELHWFNDEDTAKLAQGEAEQDVGIEVQLVSVSFNVMANT